jgi:hypothetical protein
MRTLRGRNGAMRQTWTTPLAAVGLALSVAVGLAWTGSALAATPSGKTQPCASDLASCPRSGCAQAGTAEALIIGLKRTQPPAGQPTPLTLDDFESLQGQADTLVGQKKALSQAARKKLRQLPIAGGSVSEGDLVQVTAYIVGLPDRPNYNKGESVNCRLKGKANNDFHIPIARGAGDSEFEGVVVEMIPQDRPNGWTLEKLRRIAQESRPVLIRGQLLYDNMHLVNDDQDHVKGGQPKRFSLWEIHPVSEFLVCMRDDKTCDPGTGEQWTRLENVAK